MGARGKDEVLLQPDGSILLGGTVGKLEHMTKYGGYLALDLFNFVNQFDLHVWKLTTSQCLHFYFSAHSFTITAIVRADKECGT